MGNTCCESNSNKSAQNYKINQNIISSAPEYLEKDNLGTRHDTEQNLIIIGFPEYHCQKNILLLYLNLLQVQMLSKLFLNYHIFTKLKIPMISCAKGL